MPANYQLVITGIMPFIMIACLVLPGMLGMELAKDLLGKCNKWLIVLIALASLLPIAFVYFFNLHQTPLSQLDRGFGLAFIGFALGMLLVLRDSENE